MPLMPLPAELDDGMNSVVAPVAVLCTEMRWGCWTEVSPWPRIEYSCKAEASALRKLSRSSAVRFSSRERISSSLSTVKVMLTVFDDIVGRFERGGC
jgi:hypothetical protein